MSTVPHLAPIVASVWKLEVAVGDAVEPGDVLAVLESMKMEIPVVSSISGTVETIPVETGQIVQEGDPVVVVASGSPIPRPRSSGA